MVYELNYMQIKRMPRHNVEQLKEWSALQPE